MITRNAYSLPLLFLGLTVTVAAQGGPQWTPYDPDPVLPIEFYWDTDQAKGYLDFGTIQGRVTMTPAKKKLTIHWEDHAYSPAAYRTQVIPLSYLPTSATVVRGDKILVGGKRQRNLNTVMELFDLGAPITQLILPGGEKVIDLAPIQSIQTLYDDAQQGKDLIRSTFLSRVDPDLMFIHFWDSGELFHLHLLDPNLTLVKIAGPEADPAYPGLMIIPQLELPSTITWSANHSVHGVVYILRSTLSNAPSIILMDADGNSILDNHMVTVGMDWVNQGFADSDLYTDLSQP